MKVRLHLYLLASLAPRYSFVVFGGDAGFVGLFRGAADKRGAAGVSRGKQPSSLFSICGKNNPQRCR